MTRVLIVDDLRPLAEQYAYDLARIGGYETQIASNGPAALQAVGSGEVDCVVLDLEMPGMDGFEVLETMRARVEKAGDPTAAMWKRKVSLRSRFEKLGLDPPESSSK